MSEKLEPRSANDNPWYCLATLYGEQPKDSWDDDLAAKNRVVWNRWIAETLSDDLRATTIKSGFLESELTPLTAVEKDELCSAFASRTGRDGDLPPDPAKHIDFGYTIFDCRVSFSGFLFGQSCNFGLARFSEQARFISARFNSVLFNSVKFQYANFSSASFSFMSIFSSAAFAGIANFESTTFEIAYFDSADFFEEAFFRFASFAGAPVFKNANFARGCNFAHVQFERWVPDFRGAKMHEATEWHGVRWPRPPWNPDAAQEQVYAYERLKQEMERLKKHDDEQFFFSRELRARRGLASPFSGAWLLNYAYEISSGYGQSMLRPILWIVALFAMGSSVFVGLPVFNAAPMSILKAMALSFANIFSFLPIKREMMPPEAILGLSGLAQIVSVAQSLLGIMLLFLLGLALRSRFRMR